MKVTWLGIGHFLEDIVGWSVRSRGRGGTLFLYPLRLSSGSLRIKLTKDGFTGVSFILHARGGFTENPKRGSDPGASIPTTLVRGNKWWRSD